MQHLKNLINALNSALNLTVKIAKNASEENKDVLDQMAERLTTDAKELQGWFSGDSYVPTTRCYVKGPQPKIFEQLFRENGGKPVVATFKTIGQFEKMRGIVKYAASEDLPTAIGIGANAASIVVAPKGTKIDRNLLPKGFCYATAIHQDGKLVGVPQNLMSSKYGKRLASAVRTVKQTKSLQTSGNPSFQASKKNAGRHYSSSSDNRMADELGSVVFQTATPSAN